MKKRLSALLLTAALLLSGCGGQSAAAAAEEGATVFTDDLGRELTVSQPKRTAALLGSFAQIWMLAGGTICAAPDDAWKDLHLELGEEAVDLGSMHSLSLELLLGAQPEFVLASANTSQHLQWRETLEKAGITVAYFDVNDFDDYLRVLELCTALTGRTERYEVYGLAVQTQIEEVIGHSRTRLESEAAPAVLCLAASGAGIHTKNSEGSVLGRILQNLGCVNIADDNDALLEELSMETVLEEDPDYIFIIQRGDDREEIRQMVETVLEKNPVWSGLTAVKQGHVYFMEKELFNLKPNQRWGEAYQKAEEILTDG